MPYHTTAKNLGIIINDTITLTEQTILTCNQVFANMHSLKRSSLNIIQSLKAKLVKVLIFLIHVFEHFSVFPTLRKYLLK